MDEVWLEVLSSSEEENNSEEENWIEKNNGSEVKNWDEENNSSEVENWEEENNSSKNENRVKKYSSEEANRSKEYISAEENSLEINSSAEENGSEEDESMEEYFVEQSCSKEYNFAKENYSKVYSLAEESFSKGYSSAEEYSMDSSPEENNSAKEYSMDGSPEENSSEEEYSIDSSPEENSSGEEYWLEQDEPVEQNFIEEHGLIVEADAVNKEICVVEILVIGNDNCGKTQLIKGAFCDHSSFKVENHDGRDEYTIYMSKNVHFYIAIRDIMDTEFARKKSFNKEAVTFFCYDVNDLESLVSLEETWIPTFYRENMGSSFLVGIKHGPKTKPKANREINSQEQMSIQNKAQELCPQLHRARLVYCSTEVKSSMENVFQSAIDTVYPMALR